jgi:hypothetical protein
VRLQRGQHRVHRGVAAVADAVDGLAQPRQQEAAELALAVEPGDELVQLAVLRPVPRRIGIVLLGAQG